MLEENYISSVIKSDGNIIAFFDRPIAGTLGVITILVWLAPLALGHIRKRRALQQTYANQ
jgi:putative tricarboxylic transport membrane protein